MATRCFGSDDQAAFAHLSGDANPLHVDPLQARRLMFGGCAVHGLHLALWALDRLAASEPGFTGLERAVLSFDAPVLVDETVVLEPTSRSEGEYRLRLCAGARTLARFRFVAGDARTTWINPGAPPAEPCRALDEAAMRDAAGSLRPGFDPVALRALFPALDGFAPPSIAWLLASTRIVGMRLPGLHSLFVGLDVAFGGDPASPLAYHLGDWDPRFHLAMVALEGAGGRGTARALLRPSPVAQRDLVSVARDVAPGRFAGASALVIGGSRGLGEAAAKIFAAGGAQVTLTYRDGAAEAERIVAEIKAAGGRADAWQLDVGVASRPPQERPDTPFTHVLYCAAPRIRKGGATLDDAMLARYRAVFVEGLARTLAAVEPLLADSVTLVVPSTVYVEQAPPGFAEYAMAKAEGERTAEAIAAGWRRAGRGVTLLQPRFDRLATDQTAAPGQPIGTAPADPVAALLSVL